MVSPQKKQVFSINDEQQFASKALQLFRFQGENCLVYQEFISNLNIEVAAIDSVEKIPFLPISFFKSRDVISATGGLEMTFTSSGTTGLTSSRHLVRDISWYQESFRRAFERFYGDLRNYCILALLPSYLEREGSSLIYMVEDLVARSENPDSGFYLYNYSDLHVQLIKQRQANKPTLLIGVTFALLDFTEHYQVDFPGLIVMETGGMKGRREEMIRQELHQRLTNGFGVNAIHSEYGMTELLSQAYSNGNGIFHCPPWMKIIIRDTNDPATILGTGKTGAINVIDLANVNSCSFIATQDLGKVFADGSFEVLGRFDYSDVRGCNLLIA